MSPPPQLFSISILISHPCPPFTLCTTLVFPRGAQGLGSGGRTTPSAAPWSLGGIPAAVASGCGLPVSGVNSCPRQGWRLKHLVRGVVVESGERRGHVCKSQHICVVGSGAAKSKPNAFQGGEAVLAAGLLRWLHMCVQSFREHETKSHQRGALNHSMKAKPSGAHCPLLITCL